MIEELFAPPEGQNLENQGEDGDDETGDGKPGGE